MVTPLLPKATAVWLIDNTSLSFGQIADFCGLHSLEVQGIADGEVAVGIVGLDPVANGQLTQEEIDRCQGDPAARLEISKPTGDVPQPRRRGGRYTPVSRRGDRPDAISWLIKFHPELTDAQISKLVGTTKTTINAVRDRSHWNSQNIRPRDPVSLGICTQLELDEAVKKSAHRRTDEDRGKLMEEVAAAVAAEAAAVPLTPYELKKQQVQKEEAYDPRAEAEAVFGKSTAKKKEDDDNRADTARKLDDLFKSSSDD
ncbi:DUF1013 domain-containing protein [Sneathiella sp. CAU 1612]|uniref:DUF1013 domain-containing protein n=1 Tax=Sneathiella sedimenti TaxID=2816034 RepID=A0ABS3F439_9PROT|nr:cell cycle transcriptional regulator TrcR [Sneathiella sedimenti]MBO0333098.1 DUF1013 domain-containing protein [Sneathiella sedimenti]